MKNYGKLYGKKIMEGTEILNKIKSYLVDKMVLRKFTSTVNEKVKMNKPVCPVLSI